MFKCSQYISRDGKSLVFMVYTISILVPASWQCHWRWHMHTYWPRIWKCNAIQDWWGHVWTGSHLHSPPCYTGKQAPFNIQCLLLLTPLHYYIHTAPFLIWTSGSPWSRRGNGRRTCTAEWWALLCWAPCTKEAEVWWSCCERTRLLVASWEVVRHMQETMGGFLDHTRLEQVS